MQALEKASKEGKKISDLQSWQSQGNRDDPPSSAPIDAVAVTSHDHGSYPDEVIIEDLGPGDDQDAVDFTFHD